MARYRILASRSRVWIEARSNVHPIHTEAEGLDGWIDLDIASDPGTASTSNDDQALLGHLEFPVENLTSGNAFEDRELRRRIDSRRYPNITGDLKSMKQASGSTDYIVGGDLTFRGVTRSYEDTMTIDEADDRSVTLAGVSTFDIRDFGMEPPRILMLKVQPEVSVRVEIVAEREN
jgi:polyisoprenoid-binding protein YceI